MARKRRRPSTALRGAVLSLAAISAAVAGAALAPEIAAEFEILLWLLAVIPAFLLAYYRGRHGVATALAAAMAALAFLQLPPALLGPSAQSWALVLRVFIVFLGSSLGIGTLSELLYRARSRAEQLELADPVSTLPNSRAALLVLEREFAAASRGRPLTVVLFEIDEFRQLEARAGRRAAEDALRAMGRTLQRWTRRMNYSARFGPARFLSILSSGDAQGAAVFARRVQTSFSEAATLAAGLTASAGIAPYHPSMRSVQDLLRAADLALFQAQQLGPGGLRIHEGARHAAEAQESLRRLRELLGPSRKPVGLDKPLGLEPS